LEDKLTNTWEYVSRDVLQSVILEWMKRLGWVIGYEGDYYINSHSLNKISSTEVGENRGVMTFVTL
jgi:hypothetical protein